MAVLRNRLLLPEVGIAPEIIKVDEDALRLVKLTGAGSLGGATAQPLLDGGHPARGAPRFGTPGGWWCGGSGSRAWLAFECLAVS